LSEKGGWVLVRQSIDQENQWMVGYSYDCTKISHKGKRSSRTDECDDRYGRKTNI